VVAPQELDHARVAVGEVQVEERAVRDRADQLGAVGAVEQRPQLVVAPGEVRREAAGGRAGVVRVDRGLEPTGSPLHRQLHGNIVGHQRGF